MAWNRSRIDNGKCRIGNGRRFSVLNLRLAIAAIAILGVTGGVAWSMVARRTGNRTTAPNGEPSKRGLIATNAHVGASTENANPSPEKKKYSQLTREEKLAYFRDKYGDNLPDNLKPIVYYLENEPKTNYKPKPRLEAIFKYRSEREIASFLMVEPGTWMMRPVSRSTTMVL